jgi:hypothetical protein
LLFSRGFLSYFFKKGTYQPYVCNLPLRVLSAPTHRDGSKAKENGKTLSNDQKLKKIQTGITWNEQSLVSKDMGNGLTQLGKTQLVLKKRQKGLNTTS